jgi:hypothetical protein
MNSGSGKQVLLRIISDLSTRRVSVDDLSEANELLRTGLLLHGSTSDESYKHASHLVWGGDADDRPDARQGIASKRGNLLIADLFEKIVEMPGLKEAMLSENPELTGDDYEACIWAIWVVLSACQMYAELRPAETSEAIDIDAWKVGIMRHYRNHFSQDGKNS